MEIRKAMRITDLLDFAKGHCVYIYGAKTIAQRTCLYLEGNGIAVEGFIVSNRYDNPNEVYGHPVLRIEENQEKNFDVVINAVTAEFAWDVTDDLQAYHVGCLVQISPILYDKFPAKFVMNEKCVVSDRAFIADSAEIFADETSKIIIDDNVVIDEDVVILADKGSVIHIGKDTVIREKCFIKSSIRSEVNIGERVNCGEYVNVSSMRDSKIVIKTENRFDARTNIAANKHGSINLDEKSTWGALIVINAGEGSIIEVGRKCNVDKCGNISVGKNGKIIIGKYTTAGNDIYIGADGAEINIGEDNMFSLFVKMNVGSHKIMNKATSEDITNRKPIITGDHVWVGMGATLLPGCNMGRDGIIGASTVVNKSFPDGVAVAGNPARIVKRDFIWDRNEHKERKFD